MRSDEPMPSDADRRVPPSASLMHSLSFVLYIFASNNFSVDRPDDFWRRQRKRTDYAAPSSRLDAMDRQIALVLILAVASGSAFAQRGGDSSSDGRWNVTGPAWYQTPCGHAGFAFTYGLPYANWRKPCSVPIRVVESAWAKFVRDTMCIMLNHASSPACPSRRAAD